MNKKKRDTKRRPAKIASEASTALRTTLSIRGEFGLRLSDVARRKNMSSLEVVRKAVEEYVAAAETAERDREAGRTAAMEAAEIVRLSPALPNPFQDVVATLRLARATHQMQEISDNHLELEAWDADDYLLRILTELVDKLTPADEFLVVSNLRFWSSAAGPESKAFTNKSALRYLDSQRQAVEAGMALHRIILLTTEEVSGKCLEIHQEFLNNFSENPAVRIERVEYPDANSLQTARNSIGHYAYIRRRDAPVTAVPSREPDLAALVVEPEYFEGTNTINKMHFRFSRGPSHTDRTFKKYIEGFQLAAGKATSVGHKGE